MHYDNFAARAAESRSGLEESAALHSRIQSSSVEPKVFGPAGNYPKEGRYTRAKISRFSNAQSSLS